MHSLSLPALALVLVACSDPAASSGPAPGGSDAPKDMVATLPLQAGEAAPVLTVTAQGGKKLELGKAGEEKTVVFFYPKDDTPGCTVEAQGFRDLHASFQEAKVRVIGVSTQGEASHQAFIDKHSLPYDLVVDESGDVARAFRVPLTLGMAKRQTFLIGKDGKVEKAWLDVTPKGHAEEVLAAAKGG